MTERNDAIRKLRGAARIAKAGTYAARVKFRGRLYHFLTWETKGMACLAYNWACCKLGVPHRMNSFTALAAVIPDLAAEMSDVYGTLDSRFAGAAPRGNGGDSHPRVRMSSAATEVNPDDDSGYVGDPTPLMSLSPNGIEQSRAPASRNRSEDAETMPQHRAQLSTSTDGILEDCASSQQGQGIGELHSQVPMRTVVDDSTHTHQDTAGPVQGLANEAPLHWTDTAVEGAPGRADNEDWSEAYLQLMEQDCEPVAGEGDPASRAWEPKPGLQLQLQETGQLEEGEWRAGSIGDVMAGAGEDGRCELAFGEGIAFPYTTGSDTPQSVHAMRKSLVEKGGGGQEGLYVAAAGSGGPCCEQAVARGSALEQEHARQNAWIIPGPGIVIDDPNPPRPNPVAEAVGLGSSWQQECSAHPQPALSRRRSSLDEGPAPEAGARHIQAQQEGVGGVSTIGGVPLETAKHGYNASLDSGMCPRTCFYDLYMAQPAVSRAALHAVEMQPPSATLPFPDSCLPDPPAAGNTQDSLGALLEEAFMQTLEADLEDTYACDLYVSEPAESPDWEEMIRDLLEDSPDCNL